MKPSNKYLIELMEVIINNMSWLSDVWIIKPLDILYSKRMPAIFAVSNAFRERERATDEPKEQLQSRWLLLGFISFLDQTTFPFVYLCLIFF
jgi:hypothetical protein